MSSPVVAYLSTLLIVLASVASRAAPADGPISPAAVSAPTGRNEATRRGDRSPTSLILQHNIQPIYGVGLNQFGGGGQYIYRVNYTTGLEDGTTAQKIMFQGAPIGGTVLGIVRKTPQSANGTAGVLTVSDSGYGNPSGGGTTFYNVDMNTGQAVKLGTAVNCTYITDIEFSPLDHKLYGIYNDLLVSVESFGQACRTSGPGTPATITKLGKLTNVGVGPYAIAFNYAGGCEIISASDHNMAEAKIPASPPPAGPFAAPPITTAAPYHFPVADLSSAGNSETGACMSGETLIVATAHVPTGGTAVTKAFYHCGARLHATLWSTRNISACNRPLLAT